MVKGSSLLLAAAGVQSGWLRTAIVVAVASFFAAGSALADEPEGGLKDGVAQDTIAHVLPHHGDRRGPEGASERGERSDGRGGEGQGNLSGGSGGDGLCRGARGGAGPRLRKDRGLEGAQPGGGPTVRGRARGGGTSGTRGGGQGGGEAHARDEGACSAVGFNRGYWMRSFPFASGNSPPTASS